MFGIAAAGKAGGPDVAASEFAPLRKRKRDGKAVGRPPRKSRSPHRFKGETRGDPHATLRLDLPLGSALQELVAAVVPVGASG